MGFYLAALSATYLSVISFHLIFCVCGLLSAGYRVVVPLASVVCPLLHGVGSEACVGCLVQNQRTGSCTLVGGAESFPSDGQVLVMWCVLGVTVSLVQL